MWSENERYMEGIARTNRLFCSCCRRPIRKGDAVVFKLDTLRELMKDAYCSKCGEEYQYEVICDTQHPHDIEL
jgi:RNase P subunit RPR2